MKKNDIKQVLMTLVGTGIGLAIGASVLGGSAQPQIGKIDYPTVMESHPDMKVAQETMRQEYEKMQTVIKDSQSLPETERQQAIMKAQFDMREKEKQVYEPLQNKVNEAIDKVLTEKKMSGVVDSRAFIRGGVDITKEVLIKEGLSNEQATSKIAEKKVEIK